MILIILNDKWQINLFTFFVIQIFTKEQSQRYYPHIIATLYTFIWFVRFRFASEWLHLKWLIHQHDLMYSIPLSGLFILIIIIIIMMMMMMLHSIPSPTRPIHQEPAQWKSRDWRGDSFHSCEPFLLSMMMMIERPNEWLNKLMMMNLYPNLTTRLI